MKNLNELSCFGYPYTLERNIPDLPVLKLLIEANVSSEYTHQHFGHELLLIFERINNDRNFMDTFFMSRGMQTSKVTDTGYLQTLVTYTNKQCTV